MPKGLITETPEQKAHRMRGIANTAFQKGHVLSSRHGGNNKDSLSRKKLSHWIAAIGDMTVTVRDIEGEAYDIPAAQAVALAVYAKAIQHGDIPAAKLIFDHLREQDEKEYEKVTKSLTPAARLILEQAGVLDRDGQIITRVQGLPSVPSEAEAEGLPMPSLVVEGVEVNTAGATMDLKQLPDWL